jgi:hypothetical protein
MATCVITTNKEFQNLYNLVKDVYKDISDYQFAGYVSEWMSENNTDKIPNAIDLDIGIIRNIKVNKHQELYKIARLFQMNDLGYMPRKSLLYEIYKELRKYKLYNIEVKTHNDVYGNITGYSFLNEGKRENPFKTNVIMVNSEILDVVYSKKFDDSIKEYLLKELKDFEKEYYENLSEDERLSEEMRIEQEENEYSNLNKISKFLQEIKETDQTTTTKSFEEFKDELDKDCVITAKEGLITSFTPNGQWEIIKDLTGLPKHSQGGVDLMFNNGKVSFANGGALIHAANGLLLPNSVSENDRSFYMDTLENKSKLLNKEYSNLNWVQRGLDQDKYPYLTDEKTGERMTHKMTYAEEDGKYKIFPTIVQLESGYLKDFEDDWKGALEYAKETNSVIETEDLDLAEYYTQNGLIKHR